MHRELIDFGFIVDVYDPQADSSGIFSAIWERENRKTSQNYDLIILAVAHEEFKSLDPKSFLSPNGIVYDIKSFLQRSRISLSLMEKLLIHIIPTLGSGGAENVLCSLVEDFHSRGIKQYVITTQGNPTDFNHKRISAICEVVHKKTSWRK